MSLMSSISRFARSRQGRRAVDKAMNFAKSPEGKRKIANLREKVTGGSGQKAQRKH